MPLISLQTSDKSTYACGHLWKLTVHLFFALVGTCSTFEQRQLPCLLQRC